MLLAVGLSRWWWWGLVGGDGAKTVVGGGGNGVIGVVVSGLDRWVVMAGSFC